MSLDRSACRKCGERLSEGRVHTEERCIRRLMVRLYDWQLLELHHRIRAQEARAALLAGDVGKALEILAEIIEGGK
ncbi:MAG: hypothetical protein KY468_11825 [Armatimonadetes bacterium]|nr:hypothetical protein [Armatimonadota bacterium]